MASLISLPVFSAVPHSGPFSCPDRLFAELKSATGKGASELVLELLRKEQARMAAERPAKPDKAEIERILAATREMQRL